MKTTQLNVLGQSNDTLREMHRFRTLSNPAEGNRTKLAVTVCGVLLFILLASLVSLEWFELQSNANQPMSLVQITRHVIAVIALLMFLLIDGSPETLALGLFFGCESAAQIFELYAPLSPVLEWAPHYFFQMSLVFKLFFACQMARVFPKHLDPWFRWGSIASLAYALGMNVSPMFRELLSVFVKNMSELIIGIGGAWLCIRVAAAIFSESIPWRILALSLAAFAFFQGPLAIVIDIWNEGNSPKSAHITLEIYRYFSYLAFTLAAFVNISTIENRIKALSSAKARERLERMREEQRVHEAIAKTTQMLAHDVRKPFSLLKAYADSLGAAKTTAEATGILKRMIPDVQKSLKMVDQLISNVMDIGRDVPLQIKPIGTQQLIGQSIEQVFKVSKNQSITFKYHFRHHGKILGDEQQLVRVFSNILENADQAISGKPEQITISTFNDAGSNGQRISIEIHNSGSFIPKEDLKNIFDAFFTKGKKSGTGLGLAIVKKIVRSHGGEVSAFSTSKSGTSFRFLLPALFDSTTDKLRLPRSSADVKLKFPLEPSHAELYVHPIQTKWNNTASGVRILVVDDENAYAESVRAILLTCIPATSSIMTVKTVEEAMRVIDEDKVGVIICDFDFGAGSLTGLDLLRRSRQVHPETLNVLHTNHIMSPLESREFVDLHLAKPLTRDDLEPILLQLHGKRQGPRQEIAIVEDDLIFAEHLERQLKEYQVHFFSSPDDFTRMEKDHSEVIKRLTAVITDMYFSGFDETGVDVAKMVKERFEIPVLLFSNQHSDTIDQGHFDGVIPKDGKNALSILQKAVSGKD